MRKTQGFTLVEARGGNHPRASARLLVSYSETGFNPKIDALCAGARHQGWRVKTLRGDLWGESCDTIDCDLVVTDGGRGKMGLIGERYRAAGIPVAIYDLAPFRFVGQPSARAGYFRNLPGRPYDTPTSLARLGALPWPARITPSLAGPYLLIGQVEADRSLQRTPAEYRRWLDDAAAMLDHAGVPWMYRPHPKAPDVAPRSDYHPAPLHETIAEALVWARGVLCWSSTVQYEALYHRVPVTIGLRGETGLPAARPHAEADQLLARAAWSQFTFEELEQGLPLEILRTGVLPIDAAPAAEVVQSDPPGSDDVATSSESTGPDGDTPAESSPPPAPEAAAKPAAAKSASKARR